MRYKLIRPAQMPRDGSATSLINAHVATNDYLYTIGRWARNQIESDRQVRAIRNSGAEVSRASYRLGLMFYDLIMQGLILCDTPQSDKIKYPSTGKCNHSS